MEGLKCNTCVKADVCALKEQFINDYKAVQKAITFPDDFKSDLSCRYYKEKEKVTFKNSMVDKML